MADVPTTEHLAGAGIDPDDIKRVNDLGSKLAEDMLETMYDAPGIGLAAIQVGEPVRMLVADVAKEEDGRDPRVLINPTIVARSDERSLYEEGCLSIPEYFDKVERPARVRIRYLNRDGQSVEEEAEGLYAVCIQHEMDHLNGVLFIDHLSRLKRERAVTKVKKAARERIAA